MDKDTDLGEILRAVAEKSLRLMTAEYKQSAQFPVFLEKYLRLHFDLEELYTILMSNPELVRNMLIAYYQDAVGLFQEQMQYWIEGKVKPITDKRFSSEDWINNPFFSLLSQQYLLASEHTKSLLEQLEYHDKKLAKRIQFFMQQYLDALSPDNFVHTNPQLIAETIQSHGKNLLLGLHNFLSDMETGSSRLLVKMTDMDAFKVGKNLAITPGKVIYKNDMIELIQYLPQTPKVHAVPLLIIPPWINKYYILDLSPRNSFVRWLVSQGITVFIISWANPDASFAHKGLFHYLSEGPIAAIDIIKRQMQVKQVNMLGFCIGGTLLSILLSYLKTLKDNSIRSATFLASMIDFSDPGDIAVFIDEEQVTKLEERMQKKGYLEGQFMASAFNSLRASDLIWSFFIQSYLRGKAPVPFDILYWNADTTNMPAKMHSEYLRWIYLHNDLVKPGKIRINNIPIDVTQIDIPTFFVSTQKDHIAPWKTTYLGFLLMKGEKRYLLGGSGHIAGIVIPPGSEKYGFYRNKEAPKSPNKWLAKSEFHPGSWWPEWYDWLKSKSGRQIAAPDFSKLPFQPIANAPGKYVRVPSTEKTKFSR